MNNMELAKADRICHYTKKSIIELLPIILFVVLLYLANTILNFLIWISLVPVIIYIYRQKNIVNFLWQISLVAFLGSIPFIYYIKQFDFIYFILALVLTALIYIVTFLLCWFAYRKIKYPYIVLALPLIWLVMLNLCVFIPEFSKVLDFSFMQPMAAPLIRAVGNQGMVFLIILLNSLLAFYILLREKRVLKYLIFIVVIILTCFIYSYCAVPSGKKVRVALIQGNIYNNWEWRTANVNSSIIDIYEELTKEAAKSKPDIIIWPEYAIPNDITFDKNLFDRISKIAKESNAYLVFGSIGLTDQTDLKYDFIENVANVFSREGVFIGKYTSVLPFPFGGRIVPGNDLHVFDTDIGKFGIIACNEENYSYIYKLYAEKGVNFFIAIANDLPMYNLNRTKAKATFSRLAAAENNLYLLRVANTGYTQVINPYGKIIASLKPNKRDVLVADIYIK